VSASGKFSRSSVGLSSTQRFCETGQNAFRGVYLSVPLEPPDQQHWQAAAGYVELGMFLEADAELDKIDPFNRAAPEVLAIRLAIYHGLKKWELMQEIAKRLAEFEPDDIQWTISLAYATRRADSIQAAKAILLNAEPKFPNEAIIKYNLACYCCQLGEIQNAKNYLKKAFEIDLNWRMAALEDEDLRLLWDSL
jgi:tetratricopeptide (TPR) repeat protein